MENMIDGAVIIVYLVISFGLGLLANRLLKTDTSQEEGYYLAGRKMPGWLAGSSYSVTAMNADVAPFYAAMAIGVGAPIAWFYLSRFAFAFLIGAILFAFFWRRMRISTAPEFYSLRYAGKYGSFIRVYTALFSIFLGMIPWIGAGILGLHLIAAPIFGIESKALTLAIVLPLLLAYVWVSGYAGVVVTDALQSLLIVAANLVIGILVLVRFGGPSGLATAIQDAMGPQSTEVLSSIPVDGNALLSPMLVILWIIIPTIGYGGNLQTEGQRLLSCKNEKEAMKSLVWAAIVLFAMLFTLTIPVLGLLPDHPELYTGTAEERERAYGMLLDSYLPVGLLGLALAALVASVMSTIDSHLNYASQMVSNDLYGFLSGDEDSSRRLFAGRLSMIVIMVCSILVVYNATSLTGIAVTLLGLVGATASINWGQWRWWRVNFPAWVGAMIGGPIIYLILQQTLPNMEWWTATADTLGETGAELMGLFRGAIAIILTTFLWVVVALLTKPEEEEVLKAFYRKARPLGWWGPIAKAVDEEDSSTSRQEESSGKGQLFSGLGLAILGGGWISLLFVGLSQLYIGAWLYGAGSLLLTICGAVVFWKLFDKYYKGLEGRFK